MFQRFANGYQVCSRSVCDVQETESEELDLGLCSRKKKLPGELDALVSDIKLVAVVAMARYHSLYEARSLLRQHVDSRRVVRDPRTYKERAIDREAGVASESWLETEICSRDRAKTACDKACGDGHGCAASDREV